MQEGYAVVTKDGAISRRGMLRTSGALAASAVLATPLRAEALDPSPITPALIDAARREGKVAFYTALDLPISEKLARTFEAKYPGIAVRVERSGSERVFQRIGQERQSGINAVDVACTTDPGHFLTWKRDGWLAPFVPEDVARHFRPEYVDADGMYATVCCWLSAMGYNTKLLSAADAPKSFADLLDQKWAGKMVKAHPADSGPRLTA